MTHSTTMDGHGSAVGGAIVDGGNFDWLSCGQVPRSDPAWILRITTCICRYLGKGGAFNNKATVQLMRDFWLHSVTSERLS